ncbi:MAG: choice-of-anchor L domain-containing protein [Polyangiaceae bacterium]
MSPRTALPRLAWTLPLALLAVAASAVMAPACDGSSTSTTGSGGAGGSGDCPVACADPTPVCNAETQTCVECIPGGAACGAGQYCDAGSNECLDGCESDAECTDPMFCDPMSHQCVTCNDDSQCDSGSVCSPSGNCVAGCSDSSPCGGGLACCGGACVDLTTDTKSCGECAKPCPNLDHAAEVCQGGICLLGMCEAGFADCNLNPDDGCEWNLSEGPCSCTPGETQECYAGPPGTKDVGTCKAGVSTCNDTGTGWGSCEGQVIPGFDTCADGLDNDCDGTPDNAKDLDGDGWTPCDGDCCDVAQVDVCGDPGLVNPGAFEVPNNDVDDDCDGIKDNPLPACDAGLASNSATATDYAKAIDLCASTVETPADKKDKKWGVISAVFARANGTGNPASDAKSIRSGFGSGVTPLAGQKLVVLSTGAAAAQAAPNNASPAYVAFQGGKSQGITSPVPADWLAANNNNFPNAPGCPEPQGGTTANDPIMLKVRVRVPTNAKSFDVSTNFYSSEYPEWVCSAFNDFFLALLDSSFVPGMGQVGNPADKNLAFYKNGNNVYPVGVNLATGNTGLFSQCQSSTTGCGSGAVAGSNTCMSTAQLVGTGFDDPNPPAQFAGDPAWCQNTAKFAGGATGWLTTTGNVKPGETIELRFVLWDTGDGWYDSVALIDNFLWSLDASTPGTHQ